MHFTVWQWALAGAAAVLVGVSKTGLPGAGILVVTLLAQAFGGKQSPGIMLPMLVVADIFAVAWYRRHAQWNLIGKLAPWVVVGLAIGAVTMQQTLKSNSTKDIIGLIIGILVLMMLVLHLLKQRFGDKLTPKSKAMVIGTGTAAGFTTMVSNAAGPIMTIYVAGFGMSTKEFVGTLAWYFFIFNLTKVPIYVGLGMITPHTLMIDAIFCGGIFVGAFLGRWLLPRISQKAFNDIVLFLAGASAIDLIIKSLR